MARTFQRSETVVCSILVKTAAAVLTDPATSMNIVITGPTGASIVASTAMTRDSAGTYHYDYQPAVDALKGIYQVKYTATDGTRITIQSDSFVLE